MATVILSWRLRSRVRFAVRWAVISALMWLSGRVSDAGMRLMDGGWMR